MDVVYFKPPARLSSLARKGEFLASLERQEDTQPAARESRRGIKRSPVGERRQPKVAADAIRESIAVGSMPRSASRVTDGVRVYLDTERVERNRYSDGYIE